MKPHRQWAMLAFIAASALCLPQRCKASESGCDESPRIISAFGAENNAGPAVSLASDIRSQLPELHETRRILNTNLVPSGEQVVIYDSSADDSDPHPKVAVVAGGRVARLFDGGDFNPHSGGFERYLSSCEFDLAPSEKALAVAVSSGYDGAATVFAIIRWHAGQYRVVFNPIVGQGRIEFGSLKLELWDMIWGKVKDPKSEDYGNYECVWCPHRYRVTEYLWRNGKYVKAGSYRTRRLYDPSDISKTSLLVMSRFDKKNGAASR
jgi:hypothetical protein